MAKTSFPGRIISQGEPDKKLVSYIQSGLSARGYGPFSIGVFDKTMASVVCQFQAQQLDLTNQPLKVDGKVGPFTWAAIFSVAATPAVKGSPLLETVMQVAASQVGVYESPLGSNSGPVVDLYLRSVGIKPGVGAASDRFWCAAFVFWCFEEAAKKLGKVNPAVRTAGVLDHWRWAKKLTPAATFLKEDAVKNPALLVPGTMFIHDHKSGKGHIGFVEAVNGASLVTIEGNIAAFGAPGRNGVCVARSTTRKTTDEKLVGFIRY